VFTVSGNLHVLQLDQNGIRTVLRLFGVYGIVPIRVVVLEYVLCHTQPLQFSYALLGWPVQEVDAQFTCVLVNYKATDFTSELKRRGTQYDLIIDNASPEPIYSNSQHYLKQSGAFVTIAGSLTIGSVEQMGRIQYLPSWLGGGTRKAKFLLEHSDTEACRQIVDWMAEGKLKMVVEKRFELEEAFAELQKGSTKGKIVIKVAGE
jgi:NADPH-dependent curcumin reductase CurA